jgi:ParB-like chromosome segregation protein Spo0J
MAKSAKQPTGKIGEMVIRRIAVGKVNPAPYNPRKKLAPGDPAWERLRESMQNFGCVEPLVWNERTGNLVGGHQRFSVLTADGATEVDVSVVDLDPEREKVLNVALNKVSGEWDEEALAKLFADLESAEAEIDIALTGFDTEEIEGLLSEVEDDAGSTQVEVETKGKKAERSGFNVHLTEEAHELLQRLTGILQAERPAGSREVSKHEALRVAVMEAIAAREGETGGNIRKSENPRIRTSGKSAGKKGRGA